MKKSLKFCKSKTGFTLVELVIVIAIVIILSVISVPIYRAYVDKSKYAEGYALIGTIISAEKAYYSEYGNFFCDGIWTVNKLILGIDARSNKYFSSFAVNSESDLIKERCRILIAKPAELITNEKPKKFIQYWFDISGAEKSGDIKLREFFESN